MSKRNNDKLLYIIRNTDTNKIKIGITQDIDTRFSTIENQSGCIMELVYTTPMMRNAEILETQAHEHLKGYRYLGEWFSISKEKAIYVIESLISLRYIPSQLEDEVDVNKMKAIGVGVYRDNFHNFYLIKYENKKWKAEKLLKVSDVS